MKHDSGKANWVFNLYDEQLGIPRTLAEGIQARIFAGNQAMLSIVKFEPNTIGKLHSHPEEQWGVLLEGECIRVQGGEEITMRKGDFWHTPGDVSHTIKVGATGALVLDIFSPPRPEYKQAGEGFGEAKEAMPSENKS